MGGLKTTKSLLSWEVIKKDKEEMKDSFRRSEQWSLTNHRQQLLAPQVAFITTIAKKTNINDFNGVEKRFLKMDTKGVCTWYNEYYTLHKSLENTLRDSQAFLTQAVSNDSYTSLR